MELDGGLDLAGPDENQDHHGKEMNLIVHYARQWSILMTRANESISSSSRICMYCPSSNFSSLSFRGVINLRTPGFRLMCIADYGPQRFGCTFEPPISSKHRHRTRAPLTRRVCPGASRQLPSRSLSNSAAPHESHPHTSEYHQHNSPARTPCQARSLPCTLTWSWATR